MLILLPVFWVSFFVLSLLGHILFFRNCLMKIIKLQLQIGENLSSVFHVNLLKAYRSRNSEVQPQRNQLLLLSLLLLSLINLLLREEKIWLRRIQLFLKIVFCYPSIKELGDSSEFGCSVFTFDRGSN